MTFIVKRRSAERRTSKESSNQTTSSPSITRALLPVHFVLIPKRHVDSLLSVDDDLLVELLGVVRRVATTDLKEHEACRVLTNLDD